MGNRKKKKVFCSLFNSEALELKMMIVIAKVCQRRRRSPHPFFSAIKTTIKIDAFLAVFSGSKKSHLVGK